MRVLFSHPIFLKILINDFSPLAIALLSELTEQQALFKDIKARLAERIVMVADKNHYKVSSAPRASRSLLTRAASGKAGGHPEEARARPRESAAQHGEAQ